MGGHLPSHGESVGQAMAGSARRCHLFRRAMESATCKHLTKSYKVVHRTTRRVYPGTFSFAPILNGEQGPTASVEVEGPS